jgi:hypothetical protein
MWAIRAVNSEASLQQACNVWKTRDAHKRHASELQIDWKEEERVLGRDTSIGKKKYNKNNGRNVRTYNRDHSPFGQKLHYQNLFQQ